jgi:thermitase
MGVPKYILTLIILAVAFTPSNDIAGAFHTVGASSEWRMPTERHDVIIAVLDTGIDTDHQELSRQVAAEINFTDSPTSHDVYGHGTHVAGILVANNLDASTATLVSGFRLMNVKVADDRGECCAEAVAAGIVWAVDNGANIINISLELKEPSAALQEAVEYAWNRGAIIIAAAGNDGSELPTYPAYYENCIAVAAITKDDQLVPLSNHGDWVDVAADGLNIFSTLPDNGHGYKTGTSFAAASVSHLAALLFEVATDKNGNGWLNDEVRVAIEAGCRRIGISGVGKGRIDIAKSLTVIGAVP